MELRSFQTVAWSLMVLTTLKVASAQLLPCAEMCNCYIFMGKYKADCSGKGLSQLPGDLDEEMQIIDLSNNLFQIFPPMGKFIYLEKLDLSNNKIQSLDPDALQNLTNLESLNLSHNNITSWRDIHPNVLLQNSEYIRELDLSQNKLNSFGNLKDDEYLVSLSLQVLRLSDCGIYSVHGTSPIRRLTSLSDLVLSHNPLRRLQKLVSSSLSTLDVSYCELNYIHHSELSFLPSLNTLIMAHNYRLSIATTIGALSSESLKSLDVSYCNLEQPSILGFPYLREANIMGNMIRQLKAYEFINNSKLETLDISSNSINTIDHNAFRGLTKLLFLNLSMNVISNIADDTFLKTPNLQTLLLSRNYLTIVSTFKSSSITKLDMSLCEIQTISVDALEEKTEIIELDLGRNLISRLPDNLYSQTLETLNLSDNRLSSINNRTFSELPRLVALQLAGNRFSTIWKPEYFSSNAYLQEITLGDNTWRCECSDPNMQELYEFLTFEPSKVWNPNTLVCQSPASIYGSTWFEACYNDWYASNQGTNERVLTFIMAICVGFVLCIFFVIYVRKVMNARLEREREERSQQVEEARERLRLLQLRHEQQAQINAPDPRDLISPPTYDEALLMPRLDSSFHSLADFETSGGKKKRRRGRRRTKSSNDILETQDDDPVSPEYVRSEIAELEHSPRARRRASMVDVNACTVRVQATVETHASVQDLQAPHTTESNF